jgi:hypothetical protein
MARRIIAAVGRALNASPVETTTASPHFHQGAQGNVAACFQERCDRPHLNV